MEREPLFSKGMEPPEGMVVYNEEGVDLSLIRRMLALSMEERLRVLQDHANSILMMRHELTIS